MRILIQKTAVLMLLATTLFGCQQRRRTSTSKPKPPPKLAPIAVGVVPERVIEKTVELPATIMSDEEAMLMPMVAGYVDRVLVDIGDEVAEGQTLVEMRAPELQQRAAQQQLRIEHIAAEEQVLRAELASARAELQQYEAESALRGSERDRVSRLVSSGAIERQRLEEAEFAVQSAGASIARYENAVRVAMAHIDQGKSKLAVAEAALEEAETLAGYLTIVAPFAGVVTKRNVDPGNLVSPDDSDDALLRVAKVDELRAVLHATTDVAGKLKVGQIVRFTSDDAPDQEWEAPIARLAGAFDARTRMMRVEVDYENPRDPLTGIRALRAGSYGSAEVVLAATVGKVPVVPPEAIRRRGEQALVAIVADGKCFLTPVALGLAGDELVEIQSGLAAGAQVVASGVDAIKDEQTVNADQVKPAQW